jgi:hypothetical protein
MGRRRRALGVAGAAGALAIVAAAALVALNQDRSSGGEADAATTTTTTEPSPSEPEIELVDPGAEPRRAVRLALTAGDRTTVRHTTDVDVVVRGDERTQRFDPPAATHVVAYVVRQVEGSVALVDAVIEAVDADDVVMRDALAPMVGTRTSFEVDALGRASSVAFEIPPEASDTLRSQLHQLEDQAAQLGALLPEAPMGVGARWQVTTDRTLDGVATTVVTTFTATELTDEVLRYRSEVTIRAGGSQLAGSGSGTMPLRTIAPQWTTEVTGSIEPGQEMTIHSTALPSGPR